MTWPAIDVHRDYVTAQLKVSVTVSTIHQRLVDEHGLETSVAPLRRWVGANLPEEARRAQVRVLRPGPVDPPVRRTSTTAASGCGPIRPPATSTRCRAFVMVLSCSRYMFVRPVLRMDDQEAGPATTSRRSRSSVGSRPAGPGNVPRNISGFCGRLGYVTSDGRYPVRTGVDRSPLAT